MIYSDKEKDIVCFCFSIIKTQIRAQIGGSRVFIARPKQKVFPKRQKKFTSISMQG